MPNVSLLDNSIRVSTPFIKVTIADYTFGVFEKSTGSFKSDSQIYQYTKIKYPNYIQSLTVAKINGKVNEYTLVLKYAITPDNDPNFFEKVFSKVSKTRKITFSYGDLSAPSFLYKDEEGIITDITQSLDISSSSISYTVSAVSTSNLGNSSACNFKGYESRKPSDVIFELLKNNSKYGLLDIYTGMKDLDLVKQNNLIARDDIAVKISAKTNISVLDYLQYLVNSMRSSTNTSGIYVFKTIDDTSGVYGGSYFKVINSNKSRDSLDTYDLEIGCMSSAIVTEFTVDNNESFSILYDHSTKLNTNEYVQRIDNDGNIVDIYSPIIGSNNTENLMTSEDKTWWENVTQYPISAQIKIKGVLRPAVLMSKIRLKVYFYGKLHDISGLYIINKQVDSVGLDGCWTTLKLVRVDKDE